MPKKKYYVISESKLHEEVKNKLFTTYKPIELPVVQDLTPEWHGKKIPLAMWQEILAFMKHSYDVLKSETMCFLYYDEKKAQPWSFWVPPQITSGMTVKSDPEHINFQAQRAQYPDIMFGTVHHHCSTSAFQSGTDEADETNREGFHFTIGNLDKEDIDIHFRWCLDNQCHELDDLSVAIDGAESPFKDNVELTADMHELEVEYMNAQYAIIPDVKQYDFTEYMDNVSKATIPAYKTYKAKSPYQSYWSDWGDMHLSKKTTEEPILDNADVADEILFNIKLDIDAEELITGYYRQFESKDASKLIMELASGKTEDEEYARVIHAMLTDSVFLATTEGSYFYKLFSEQLDTCNKTGYRVTENDILQEMEKLSVHDYRETL